MRINNAVQMKILMAWHAVFGGGFIVAYLSEDVAGMHLFAGSLVLGAVFVRGILALLVKPKAPLAIKNPMAATRLWFERRAMGGKVRNPLFAWFATMLLGVIGTAAATGWMAKLLPWTEDLHEGIAEMTVIVIVGHLGVVFYKTIKKRVQDLIRAYGEPQSA